jgi:hypothetical protein
VKEMPVAGSPSGRTAGEFVVNGLPVGKIQSRMAL